MNLVETPVTMQLRGTSSGGTGPDLTGYPHLVYAPAQWGEGVRTEINGTRVAAVASMAALQCRSATAQTFGVTLVAVPSTPTIRPARTD